MVTMIQVGMQEESEGKGAYECMKSCVTRLS